MLGRTFIARISRLRPRGHAPRHGRANLEPASRVREFGNRAVSQPGASPKNASTSSRRRIVSASPSAISSRVKSASNSR